MSDDWSRDDWRVDWSMDGRPLALQRPEEMSDVKACSPGVRFVHEVKSWSMFFKDILTGERTSDIRYHIDRRYQVGDTLHLREFDPVKQVYTGRTALALITYIQKQKSNPCAISEFALHPDYCVLSIKVAK